MERETNTIFTMYKGLFIKVKNLIISPNKEWKVIFNEKQGSNSILTLYSLPLMGISTVATFIGFLLNHQDIHFDLALIHAAFAFSAFFFGLYAAYFLNLKILPLFGYKEDKEVAFKLTAFPSLIIYIIHLLTTLLPETFFLRFLVFYAGFIIWEAFSIMQHNHIEKRILMTVTVSFIVLFLPYLIFQFLYKISGL